MAEQVEKQLEDLSRGRVEHAALHALHTELMDRAAGYYAQLSTLQQHDPVAPKDGLGDPVGDGFGELVPMPCDPAPSDAFGEFASAFVGAESVTGAGGVEGGAGGAAEEVRAAQEEHVQWAEERQQMQAELQEKAANEAQLHLQLQAANQAAALQQQTNTEALHRDESTSSATSGYDRDPARLQQRLDEAKEMLRVKDQELAEEAANCIAKLADNASALKKESEKTRKNLLKQIDAKKDECEKLQAELDSNKNEVAQLMEEAQEKETQINELNKQLRQQHAYTADSLLPGETARLASAEASDSNELVAQVAQLTRQVSDLENWKTFAQDTEAKLHALLQQHAVEDEKRRAAGDLGGRVLELEALVTNLTSKVAEEEAFKCAATNMVDDMRGWHATEKDAAKVMYAEEKEAMKIEHDGRLDKFKAESHKTIAKLKETTASLTNERDNLKEDLTHLQEEIQVLCVWMCLCLEAAAIDVLC